MRTRLVINGFEIDLRDDIDIDLNLSVADAKNPSIRKRNSSQVITVGDSVANRRFFYATYCTQLESNKFTADFNPSTRAEAQVYDGETLIFDGLFQVRGVKQMGDALDIEGILYSNFLSIYEKLQDIEISELGWSEYDHPLTTEAIVKSWFVGCYLNGSLTQNQIELTAGRWFPYGFGYRYNLVDWGLAYNRSTSDSHFSTDVTVPKTYPKWIHNELKPFVYAEEVIKKIFDFAGVTIKDEDGTFYSNRDYSDTDKNPAKPLRFLMLGNGGGDFPSLGASELSARAVTLTTSASAGVGINSTFTSVKTSEVSGNDLVYGVTKISTHDFVQFVKMFPLLTFSTTTDTSSQYQNNKVTFAKTGTYRIALSGSMKFRVTTDLDFMKIRQLTPFGFRVWLVKNGLGGTRIPLKEGTVSFATRLWSTVSLAEEITVDLSSNNDLIVQQGEEYELYLELFGQGELTIDESNPPTNTPIFNATVSNTTALSITQTSLDKALQTNDTVQIAPFLPKMKARDFLSEIIKLYNLYCSDINEDGEMSIKSLDDMTFYGIYNKGFYTPRDEDFDDWTDKIDYSKEIEITPMPVIEAKRYIYGFKEQNDYYNEIYKTSTQKRWGERTYDVPTTWIKGDKVNRSMFATTPPVQVGDQDNRSQVVVPRIIEYNAANTLEKPYNGNPLLFYYWNVFAVKDSGVKNYIYIEDTVGITRIRFNYYGACGNLTPRTVTDFGSGVFKKDLLFLTPDYLYYNLADLQPATSITYRTDGVAQSVVAADTEYSNVNMWDYHKRPLYEVTNADSKAVSMYVNLSDVDVKELDFSKLKKIDQTFYKLNAVNYKVGADESSLCEFIKVIEFKLTKPATLVNPPPPPKPPNSLFKV